MSRVHSHHRPQSINYRPIPPAAVIRCLGVDVETRRPKKEKRGRLSIISHPYPTFFKIWGRSVALPSGWRRGEMTCSQDGRLKGWEEKKRERAELGGPCVHTRTLVRELLFSDGHLCRLPGWVDSRLVSHNLMYGLSTPTVWRLA